jgi:hypothetical protein
LHSGITSGTVTVANLESGLNVIQLFAGNIYTNAEFVPGVGQYLLINITYTA